MYVCMYDNSEELYGHTVRALGVRSGKLRNVHTIYRLGDHKLFRASPCFERRNVSSAVFAVVNTQQYALGARCGLGITRSPYVKSISKVMSLKTGLPIKSSA
jgi:hypothetical protein